jgi:hypothetical protein
MSYALLSPELLQQIISYTTNTSVSIVPYLVVHELFVALKSTLTTLTTLTTDCLQMVSTGEHQSSKYRYAPPTKTITCVNRGSDW